jgi:hypothetical protein
MTLPDYIRKQTTRWEPVFSQDRTLDRAVTLGFGILCGLGKRTITRAISFQGNTQKDWSADYKVFSRSKWSAHDLFTPILEEAISEHRLEHIVCSADDTRVWRTGKHVPQAQWHRDPMGPPFHTNLRWGHRFLQASLVLPLYQQDPESSSRCVPIRFELAPVVKKPGKKASPEAWAHYEKEKKEKNLSVQFVAMTEQLRAHLNQTGHAQKMLTMVVDGSFCNKRVFRVDWQEKNVAILSRCRKDIVLCKRARGPGPRFYAKKKITPEKVRRSDSIAPWQTAQIFHGGCFREVRFKELKPVYWQGGARKKPVRLLIVAPVGYRTSKNGRKYYRQPAYLLTTDLATDAATLLQHYFDRWGIEINHRDEKEILGVGQAQVWNEHSVSKVPALLVAMYSWLLLAGLACYGPKRGAEFEPLPKWRRHAKRPSCLDLVTLLRRQLNDKPVHFAAAAAPTTYPAMVGTAAA